MGSCSLNSKTGVFNLFKLDRSLCFGALKTLCKDFKCLDWHSLLKLKCIGQIYICMKLTKANDSFQNGVCSSLVSFPLIPSKLSALISSTI